MTSPAASGKLEGAEIGKLTDLIASAFEVQQLEQLVRKKLNSNLQDIVALNGSRPTIIYNLITALEQTGDLNIFLQGVVDDRPRRSDLRDYIEKYCLIIDNLPSASSSSLARPAAGAIPPCPYPGLSYFGPADSRLFFGREQTITRLVAAVSNQALTALVGASGSGKSSVVLAGLAPRLHQQGDWRFTHFRVGLEPDKNPFMALARALVPLFADDDTAVDRVIEVEKLARKLEAGEVTLTNVLGQCRLQNPGKRILLIADQFEEIFTLVPEGEQRQQRFIDLLLSGFVSDKASKPPETCLILTLRADFYGRAIRYRPLSNSLQDRVENLGPISREELQEAIIKPAGKIAYEAGLIETILDDVANRPGNLPLVGPENLRRPIMLKISFRTAILRPYEPHFIFRDRFPDGRLPLPTFPTA